MISILAATFFRLHERMLKRPTFSILRQLEQSQRWPRERIEELRRQRLRGTLQAAYEHTPYWRSVMDKLGMKPGDVHCLADLKRFPLLQKETLRSQREEMVWREAGPRVKLATTSGSTNEALQFYTNSYREACINAARMRGHEWVGIRRGEKEMYFWGSPVELSTQDRFKHLRDFLVNDGLSDGFELSPQRVRQCVEQWRQWRPRCIFGYPSSFVLLIHMARQQDLDLSGLKKRGLKNICTTSEMLTDVDRKIIAEAFGVGVYDSYGLREGGLIGHECLHGTMHTMDEQLILETIDPQTLQPTSGEGELVLTSLISPAMPIIRYRTGDIVTLSQRRCPCGMNLDSLRISGGRIADFIVTAEGKWVVGYSFIYIARSVPGIVKFQAQQERQGEVTVLLATDDRFPADGAQRVAEAARARLGGNNKVEVKIVADISPAASGKYRPVVSTVGDQLRRQGRFEPEKMA